MKLRTAKFEFFSKLTAHIDNSMTILGSLVFFVVNFEHIWDFILMFSVDFDTYFTFCSSIFTVAFEQVCMC